MEAETRYLSDEDATVAFGESLGAAAKQGAVIFLRGDLGAGKTTLCRGVLKAFGHQGAVKSPTYTLVEPYIFAEQTVYHFDLYRLGDPEELEYMGIRDYLGDENLCLIEWPDRGAGYLPPVDIEITLMVKDSGREVRCAPCSGLGEQICKHLV